MRTARLISSKRGSLKKPQLFETGGAMPLNQKRISPKNGSIEEKDTLIMFDPRAEAGFMLARCSNDNYFAMVDVLFKQQQTSVAVENAKDALAQISKLAGFSQESFEACLTDQKLLDDVRAVRERGSNEFKVDSTPTFFINGKKYPGALSIEEMSAIIDAI